MAQQYEQIAVELDQAAHHLRPRSSSTSSGLEDIVWALIGQLESGSDHIVKRWIGGTDGSLSLITPDGRTGTTGAGPADMALSVDSQFLYVRNGRAGTIGAFAVQADGSLQALGDANGLPAGSAGLAAY